MKDELRSRYKLIRKGLSPRYMSEASAEIAEQFVSRFSSCDSFFIYYSFGSEADTKKLIARLISLNKRVFLPRVEGGKMVPVEYYGQPMKRSSLGVMEPQGQVYGGAVDVVAVPGLAFNARGYRLGYGGGYYDAYLKNSSAVRAGIGFACQLTDASFEDEWDEPLDLLITERGTYLFGRTTDRAR